MQGQVVETLGACLQHLAPGNRISDDLDETERIAAVRKLVEDWYIAWSDWDPKDAGKFMGRLLMLFGLDTQYDGSKLQEYHQMWCQYLSEIGLLIVDCGLQKDEKVAGWFERVRLTENSAWQAVNRLVDIHSRPCRDICRTNLTDQERLLDPKCDVDHSKISEKVMILHILLKDAGMKRYVRMEGVNMDIYEPVYKDRQFVHFYQRRGTVKDYISEWTAICENTNFELYSKIQNLQRDWLEKAIENRWKHQRPLPLVSPDRLSFAFANGAYFTVDDRFLPRESRLYREIPDSLICANYFPDIEFPYKEFTDLEKDFKVSHSQEDPRLWFLTIPTPNCDRIINFQGWKDRDVVILFWALIGRTFRNIGEQDSWQVAPLYEGKSGCGKSTIAEMVYRCYAMKDVGILSNDMQETFGLEHIYRKFIVAGLDLKANFKLPEMLANCMISGEALVVNRKHRIAIDHIWNIPLLFACTEFPPWLHGMQRRLITFPFKEAVGKDKIDDNLKYAMAKERAYFMKKANLAYLYWRKRVEESGKSFAANLPQYFVDVQKVRLRKSSYAMKFFCEEKENGQLQWGNPGDENTYVEAHLLQQRFSAFVRTYSSKSSKIPTQTDLTANGYEDARSFCGVRYVENVIKQQTIPPFQNVVGNWYTGIYLVANKGPPPNITLPQTKENNKEQKEQKEHRRHQRNMDHKHHQPQPVPPSQPSQPSQPSSQN